MWRKKISLLLQLGCKSSLEPTPRPIKVGDDKIAISTLPEKHSVTYIYDARCASTALCGAVDSPARINKIYERGSPSEGWQSLEDVYRPKEVVMLEQWATKYKNVRMHRGGDPQI